MSRYWLSKCSSSFSSCWSRTSLDWHPAGLVTSSIPWSITEVMHKARLRGLKGRRVSSKSPSRARDQDDGVTETNAQTKIVFPRRRAIILQKANKIDYGQTWDPAGAANKYKNLVGMSTSGKSPRVTLLVNLTKADTGLSRKSTTPSRMMTASELEAIFFCRATFTFPSPKVDSYKQRIFQINYVMFVSKAWSVFIDDLIFSGQFVFSDCKDRQHLCENINKYVYVRLYCL